VDGPADGAGDPSDFRLAAGGALSRSRHRHLLLRPCGDGDGSRIARNAVHRTLPPRSPEIRPRRRGVRRLRGLGHLLFRAADGFDVGGRRLQAGCAQRRVVESMAAAGLGSRGTPLLETRTEHPVQALPERVRARAGRPRPLPQSRLQDGKLYTLAYAIHVRMHVDPIEKKPLFHFLPDSSAFSIATAAAACAV